MALPDFPIPSIRFFTNKNAFTGSHKGMNYRIIPQKGDAEKGTRSRLEAAVWYGMLCSEKSVMVAEENFSLDADGLDAAREWIVAQYGEYCAKEEK